MSQCGPVVVGATCDDQINYGETIDLLFTYQDSNGQPIDLSTATAEVFSSNPDVIKNSASITIDSPALGQVRFLLSRDAAASLRIGRNNSFRLRVIFSAESDDVTPDIYLQVS